MKKYLVITLALACLQGLVATPIAIGCEKNTPITPSSSEEHDTVFENYQALGRRAFNIFYGTLAASATICGASAYVAQYHAQPGVQKTVAYTISGLSGTVCASLIGFSCWMLTR